MTAGSAVGNTTSQLAAQLLSGSLPASAPSWAMMPNTTASRDGSAAHQTRQRISGWFDRALRKSGLNRGPPPPPPPLPSPRPRPITPSKGNALPCHPQTQSFFFSRLPLELRQSILLFAFGNRTIHMQLILDHPPLLGRNKDSGSCKDHGEPVNRDISAPQQWLWRSCDCHRNAPWFIRKHFDWYQFWTRPELDSCMKGERLWLYCNYWSLEASRKCNSHVGVLGWLRSCRQAYEQGIDVLYGTNTFYLSGQQLLTRLPDYIRPARLTQMATFEIVLSLPACTESGPTGEDICRPVSTTLSLALNMLAQSTRMKKLHLCLDYPHARRHFRKVDLTHILDALDQCLRLTEDAAIVVQMDSFLLKGLDGMVSTVEQWVPGSGYTTQLWRCLVGEARLEERVCHYPEVLAPLKEAGAPELGHSRGYWIVESVDYR